MFWLIGKFDFPSLVVDEVSYHQGCLGVNKIQNYYAHFTFEEAETQLGELTCPKPHSSQVSEPGFYPGLCSGF